MIENILLALLIGLVLRFIATLGVTHSIKKTKSDAELKKRYIFHVYIIMYIVGSGLKYGGLTLLLAVLVNKYLLS